MNEALWQPLTVGALQLPNRLIMAPMTRSRATPEGVPTPLNAEYYAQRASMGLIVTEATQPSDDGQGYMLTPGIYNSAQINGWRFVTDAVHAAGGRIFVQIMHVGRIGHPANKPNGHQPVAPSAVTPKGKMFTPAGMQDLPEPRALSTAEVTATVDAFRRSAAAAMEAGADGVEIHGANGYLIHQFLSSNANLRTDAYGASIENRIRFAVEVGAVIAQEIGAAHTGFRISPANPFNDIVENDTHPLYEALVAELAKLQLAYLHIVHLGDEALLRKLRALWPNVLIVNRGRTDLAARVADMQDGLADAIAVGSMSLANPDLVTRIQRNAPLNQPDPSTFYGGGAKGYTDYAALST